MVRGRDKNQDASWRQGCSEEAYWGERFLENCTKNCHERFNEFFQRWANIPSDQSSDENRSEWKNFSGSQKTKKPKPRDPPQHVNHWNCFEPLRREDSMRDSTPGDADKSFTTLLLGNSMIKQMQERRLRRKVGHHVVVKSFPGAATNDMKHYLMPTIDKSPQQIILHVGTNYRHDHTPTVVAKNIVDLARKIEVKSSAQVILSELVSRSENVPNNAVKAVN